jgi:RNA polymerase sigma-70 factor (ECF subfamily)
MLERFIEDYADQAYQFAFALCGNVEDARELVQESFYRLIQKWDQYDPSQPLDSWFVVILRNIYFDGTRKYDKRHCVSLDAPAEGRDGDGDNFSELIADAREEDLLGRLERQEASESVQEVLRSLSPEHRAVLDLCDLQGLKYEEIKDVLDCSLNTVRSRLFRARAAFRKAMLERSREVMES